MRRIIGAAFVSLDGVMQAPGGPTEDPTGGFGLGGWMAGVGDEGVGPWIGRLFDHPFDLLLGRRTYDIFAAYWPFYGEGEARGVADAFDGAAKHVLTRGGEPLAWANSTRLPDMGAVAALKRGDGPDLVVQGSSTLYPQLLAAGLLDQLTLMTFPVVLGRGKRLFGEGTAAGAMRMVDHEVTGGGVVVAVYEPGGEVRTAAFPGPEPSPAERQRRAAMAAGAW